MSAAFRRLRVAAAAAARQTRGSVVATVAVVLILVIGLVGAVLVHSASGTRPARTQAGEPTSLSANRIPTGPAGPANGNGGDATRQTTTRTTTKPGAQQASQSFAEPKVARPKHLVTPTLIASQRKPLSHGQLVALQHLSGVTHVLTIGEGMSRVDGHQAKTIAVHPASFRAWTPRLTAASNPLWSSIAAGELTASFDMGHGAKLPLGKTVPVRAAHKSPTRIGAFASVGLGPVDAVVDTHRADQIGLTRGNAVVISAPKADPLTLRNDVRSVLKSGASTTLLRQVIVIRDAGEFMTRKQIATILRAAASRIGKPYVWGATGPNSFDCSGLVQWSFAHAGITMPRVAAEQFFAGPHIPYKDARPGDLLFWHYDPTDPTDVDHVAIYAGDGKMIVAPHTGLDVMVQEVPLDHMAGVVRVDPGVASQIG